MGSQPSKHKDFKEDDSDFTSGPSSPDSDYEAFDRENNESVNRYYAELQEQTIVVVKKGSHLKEVEVYKELSKVAHRIYEINETLSTLTYSKQKNIRIQQEANNIVCKHGGIEVMCEIIISCLQYTNNFQAIDASFQTPSDESNAPEEDRYLWVVFWNLVGYLFEATNVSPPVSQRIIKHTYVGVAAQEIHDIGKIHLEKKNFDQTKNEVILESLMKVFYNLARTDKQNQDFDKALRAAGLHEILPNFIHTDHKAIRLAALAVLSEIQKDMKKKPKFDMSVDAVKLVVTALDEANKAKNGRSNGGWPGKELTHILGSLSRNYEYKKIMVHDCGCLPVLVYRAKETKKKQKRVTIRVLYSLTFNKENHDIMVNGKDGIMDLFLDLKKSKDKKVRKAAIGGLWNMRVIMVDSPAQKELAKEFLRNAKRPSYPFDKKEGDSDSD